MNDKAQADPTGKLAQALKSSRPAIPEALTAWLGRLVLLYGVPLNYLIPDEKKAIASSMMPCVHRQTS